MSLTQFLEPVSADAPCGPDLDATMDPGFEEYYFDALGRLPERFVTPGVAIDKDRRTPDKVFDPKTVKLKEEVQQIDALLARSLDLRLLVLRAQWECLAGRIEPMAETVSTIAGLLETFGDDVHPTASSGTQRREAIADLAQPVVIVTALQYAPLSSGTEVNLRRLMIAEGKVTPNSEDDSDLNVATLQEALRTATNRAKLDGINAAITTLLAALGRIKTLCQAQSTAPFTPVMDPVEAVLGEIRAMIWAARPDLRSVDLPADEPEGIAAAEGEPTPDGAAPAPAVAAPAGSIANRAQARAALTACEGWFRRFQPSSPAILLVVQARLLIGRPLIEALEVLLPEQAKKAIVEFGPPTGFALSVERLKTLTTEAALAPAGEDGDDAAAETAFDPTSSAETGSLIRAVEDYFHKTERSSPVPILLQRARGFMDKDFQQLVDELVPVPQARASGSSKEQGG